MDDNIPQDNYFNKTTDTGGEVNQTSLQFNERKMPTLRSWVLFFVLLGSTLYTTYLAGGKLYALSLFLILGAHEFGHYFAGVKNGVRTTLPLFIPAPPGLFLLGTFGAMIVIKDPIPNRRVLMEIGAAGPIAGFIVAVPTLIIGLFLSETVAPTGQSGFSFGSSIIMIILSKTILGVTPLSVDFNIQLHPLALAGWVGLFVTAINLFPIGQLDGGHILYALIGEKSKIWAKCFFAFLLFLVYFWPNWGVWAILLLVITRFKSAPLEDEEVLLQKNHKIAGYAAIVILLLTFVPVPIEFIQ
ncbi:MAG: site-2 protease family protein [Nitrospina sp.]|jgi:membrane-associated protease RseP (regulator of RpoE activity)|nr:site-2 protease family protein [Nitrospina sp.]MBT6662827.1 site-2 protease family protein [Nitrospina sp.]|tara:strand:- start:155 stop:1054 length:900 start_codon:yes stop_codon:yes gene_type:complete